MSAVRALLVDDDRELARLLTDYLGSHDVALDHVEDGARALERLEGAPAYDIVLLDVMLPGPDGFEVCQHIRAKRDVPVIMLTARGEESDRVVGLEIGADDYVPKPFNPRELLARMRAVLRRHNAPPESSVLRVQDLELDPAARQVIQGGKKLDLTDIEFGLLEALMRSPGKVVNRD